MDPITIIGLTASITSLVTRGISLGKTLQHLHTSYSNAPRVFTLLQAEFRTMRLALNNLQQILLTRKGVLESNIFPPETVADEIASVGMTMELLEEYLGGLVGLGKLQSARMVWNEPEIREFLEHFRAHKGSLLTLMMAMTL